MDPEVAREKNREARIQLADAYQICTKLDLNEGVCNHLSMIAPAADGNGKVMLLIPYGLRWCEVTPDNLVGLNDDNKVVEGKGDPEPVATNIHRGVHLSRDDITAVFHVHSPYATALGCLEDFHLQPCHQHAIRYHGRLAYDTEYTGFANSMDEGLRLGKVLGKKDVLLMCNHGALVVAPNVALAFDDLYYLERAAMFQILAMSTGKKLRLFPEAVCEDMTKGFFPNLTYYADIHFNALRRTMLPQK